MELNEFEKKIEQITDEFMALLDKRVCPVCKKLYSGYPAISRKDNKTEICSECGQAEAMEEFYKYHKEAK